MTQDHGSRLDNITIRKRGAGKKEQKRIKQKPNALKQCKPIQLTATGNHSSLKNSKQVTIEIIQPQKTVKKIDKLDKSPNSATVSVKDKGTQIYEKDRAMFMFDQEVTISVKPLQTMICSGWSSLRGHCRQNSGKELTGNYGGGRGVVKKKVNIIKWPLIIFCIARSVILCYFRAS